MLPAEADPEIGSNRSRAEAKRLFPSLQLSLKR